jgi:hypothetical protein
VNKPKSNIEKNFPVITAKAVRFLGTVTMMGFFIASLASLWAGLYIFCSYIVFMASRKISTKDTTNPLT